MFMMNERSCLYVILAALNYILKYAHVFSFEKKIVLMILQSKKFRKMSRSQYEIVVCELYNIVDIRHQVDERKRSIHRKTER